MVKSSFYLQVAYDCIASSCHYEWWFVLTKLVLNIFLSNILTLSVGGYYRNTGRALKIIYLRLYCYHWVDTTAGGLLVPEDITCSVVSVSALTWFMRYSYFLYLWFLNDAIIIITKELLPRAYMNLTDFCYLA